MSILLFDQISQKDSSVVGGKAAALGELTKLRISVPEGFVVTREETPDQILKSFDILGLTFVSVRSSASVEDSKKASWAGQFETYLNVTRENLTQKIQDCFLNAKKVEAGEYAVLQGKKGFKFAVIIQKMVESTVSGIVFTTPPVSKEQDKMLIEAGLGLGPLIVQGEITPDQYLVNKEKMIIEHITISDQRKMLTKKGIVQISQDQGSLQKLSGKKILELTKICLRIEEHYGFPCDIEWAQDQDLKLWILQSRPITTFKK